MTGPAFRRVNDPLLFDECAQMMAASDPWTTLQMTYEQCRAAFDGECKEVYVMEKDGQIAGFVILQLCGTFKGYIQTLFVSEPFRGQGMARKLLAFCEARIPKVSPNIFLCVSVFNEKAKKIYLDWGFVQVGVLDNFIKKGFDEILMRKTFSPILK